MNNDLDLHRAFGDLDKYNYGVRCSVMRGGLCMCAMDNSMEGRKQIQFLIDNKKSLTESEIGSLPGEHGKLKKFVTKIQKRVAKELAPPPEKKHLPDIVVFEKASPKLKNK